MTETKQYTVPAGFMAVMLTEHFNDSDSMTDYFHHHATPQDANNRCIGITKKGPQREDTMRNIIGAIPELKGRFDWKFHKEEYSGGHGTYLEAQESHRRNETQPCYRGDTGANIFYEVSCDKYVEGKEVNAHPDMVDRSKKVSNFQPIKVDEVTITHNEEKNGIELAFPDKPDMTVREFLKRQLHARWHFRKKIWYCKYSKDRMVMVQEKLLAA